MSSASSAMSESAGPGDLQDENAHLRQLLDESALKIMRLQGSDYVADQITDEKIGRSIKALQDSITVWINNVDQDLRKHEQDFSRIFHSRLNNEGRWLGHRELGLHQPSTHETDAEWMAWLCNLSTCIHVVIGRYIWEYLHSEILCRRYPVGVSMELTSTFNDIYSVMRRRSNEQGAVYYQKDHSSLTEV